MHTYTRQSHDSQAPLAPGTQEARTHPRGLHGDLAVVKQAASKGLTEESPALAVRSTSKRLFRVVTAAGWESNEDSNSLSFFKKLCEQTTLRHHHRSLEQVQPPTGALSLLSTPPRDTTASRGMWNAGGYGVGVFLLA